MPRPKKTAPKADSKSDAPKRPPVEIPPGTAALLSPAQVAAALGVPPRQFRRMVAAEEYPGPDVRLGPKLPRWSQALHNRWVEERATEGQSKD